ncbi:MAG: RraA family protein [Acidobacteriota bacterium]
MQSTNLVIICLGLIAVTGTPVLFSGPSQTTAQLTHAEVLDILEKESTGNIADAVEEVTGARAFMYHDMKPVFETKIVGPAVTAYLRPILKTDNREYPNYALQILDEAPEGSILVYVLENGLEIAGIGDLMATTAKVRNLGGAVIDGGARDVRDIREIGFPVFSRTITPATSVGRYVSVAKQIPVKCGGIMVHPGDLIVGDLDGVVVIPRDQAVQVVEVVKTYREKEERMKPIIRETKSMLKALEIYGRY